MKAPRGTNNIIFRFYMLYAIAVRFSQEIRRKTFMKALFLVQFSNFGHCYPKLSEVKLLADLELFRDRIWELFI